MVSDFVMRRIAGGYGVQTEWQYDQWKIKRIFKGLYQVTRCDIFITASHSFRQARKIIRDAIKESQ